MKSKIAKYLNNPASKKRKILSSDVEVLQLRVTSIQEAKQKIANGFYSRPSVLRIVANRILEEISRFTKSSTGGEGKSNF